MGIFFNVSLGSALLEQGFEIVQVLVDFLYSIAEAEPPFFFRNCIS